MATPQQAMNEFVLRQRNELLAITQSVDPWVRDALMEWFDRSVADLVVPEVGLPLAFDVVGDATLQ